MGNEEQPVVQTILESFSRCFHPSDHFHPSNATTASAATRSKTPVRRSSKLSSASSPTRAVNRLELSDKQWDDVFKSRSTDSRRRGRRSRSSTTSAKKRMDRLTPDAIEERSLKRKLEIFRTKDDDVSKPSTQAGSRTRASSNPEEFVEQTSSEEEIANLTNNRKRFACGFNTTTKDSPMMTSIAKFFNFGQSQPFGLCFATPIRTSSAERADKFTDDQLTTDEFISRHKNATPVTPELELSLDTSDLTSRADMGEEDTITSTLYFDQKYAHVIQTRPPMPLFASQAVPCENYHSDDLTRIIKKKSAMRKSPGRKKRHGGYKNSPPGVIGISGSVSSSPGSTSHQVPGLRMRDPDIVHNSATAAAI